MSTRFTYTAMRLVDLHSQPGPHQLHSQVLPDGLQLLTCVGVVCTLHQIRQRSTSQPAHASILEPWKWSLRMVHCMTDVVHALPTCTCVGHWWRQGTHAPCAWSVQSLPVDLDCGFTSDLKCRRRAQLRNSKRGCAHQQPVLLHHGQCALEHGGRPNDIQGRHGGKPEVVLL